MNNATSKASVDPSLLQDQAAEKTAIPVNGGMLIHANDGRMQEIMQRVNRVAPTNFSVLLIGKTGTGKEKVARYIHEHSKRSNGPYIAVNCGGKDANFIEDELFGHVRGGFTGANGERQGKFEAAAGGTIFLDELDKMPQELQNKLLRVLNEKMFSKIGSDKEVTTDVRVIAATNRLMTKDKSGKKEPALLPDLYHRLTKYPIRVPRLRERPEDISFLARYFVDKAAAELEFDTPPQLPEKSLAALQAYAWPGNIRQLENTMYRATLDAGNGGVITPEKLYLLKKPVANGVPQGRFTQQVITKRTTPLFIGVPRSLDEIKADIFDVLMNHDPKNPIPVNKLATELGGSLSVKTIYNYAKPGVNLGMSHDFFVMAKAYGARKGISEKLNPLLDEFDQAWVAANQEKRGNGRA